MKPEGDLLWNGLPIKTLSGTKLQIVEYEHPLIPDSQNGLIDTERTSLKSLNDIEKVNLLKNYKLLIINNIDL